MRRLYNILAIAALLISFTSCERDTVYEDDVTSPEDIIIPADNYITFHADANTRAALQTGDYIDGFGVYGYKYDFNGTWNGQRPVAKPNVFWNLDESTKVPLKVTYDGGIYSYTADGSPDMAEGGNGQVKWSGSRYAFWAYYPYEGYDTNFAISGMEQEGAPYVTYTVDRGTFGANGDVTTYGSTRNMYDVMTGGISQVTAASNGNTVTFTMRHRLSAVDVSISNVYQHDYVTDGVNHTEDVDIEISDLKLNFENLKYNSAKIFLEQDKSIPALNTVLTPANAGSMRAIYNLIGTDGDIDTPDTSGTSVSIEPTTTTKTNITADADATMTFIPQETTDLKVTANIQYRLKGVGSGNYVGHLKVNDEGHPVDSAGNVTDDPTKYVYDGVTREELTAQGIAGKAGDKYITAVKTTDFNRTLDENTRYYIVLNFTSEAVSINIITAEKWDEVPVDYEFM